MQLQTITKHSIALYIGMAKVLPIIDVQVNEKSCRLRMGAYRDGVKRKETRLGWDYNSHIVCMCIIMRRSEISLPN